MRGNGKVFISHTHEDNERCAPLLAALDAWGVDYWYDTQQLDPGQHISERVQGAIAERDIFIRIGTAASRASMWTALEMSAFRGLQLEGLQRKSGRPRFSITLILDPAYNDSAPAMPGVSERTDMTIDATNQPQALAFAELRSALGLSSRRSISRRGAIGLGAAAAITVAATTGAVVLLKDRADASKPYPKPRVIAFNNPQEPDPRMLWYYVAGSNTPAIGLAGDALYVNSDDGLTALKAADGSVIWSRPSIAGYTDNVPVVVGGVLYAADIAGYLYALHTSDGSGIWRVQPGSSLLDVLFALEGGVIYVLTDDGSVQALSATTGAIRWQSPSVGKPDPFSHSGTAAGSGGVFVGSTDGNLYALNPLSGAIKWRYQTAGAVACTPTVPNGIVYFGSKDHYVYAVNAFNGGLVWRHQHDFEVNIAPVVVGGIAYIGLGVYLTALNANTGKLLWQVPASDLTSNGQPTGFDSIAGQVAVAGNMIYACAGIYLYAFGTNSPTRYTWRYVLNPNSTGNSATPVVGNGVVYVGGDNHTVYAVKVRV